MTAIASRQNTDLSPMVRHLIETKAVEADPIDVWITENSAEWSERFPGKYLALAGCELVSVAGSRAEAFGILDDCDPKCEQIVWYVPKPGELECIL